MHEVNSIDLIYLAAEARSNPVLAALLVHIDSRYPIEDSFSDNVREELEDIGSNVTLPSFVNDRLDGGIVFHIGPWEVRSVNRLALMELVREIELA